MMYMKLATFAKLKYKYVGIYGHITLNEKVIFYSGGAAYEASTPQ